MLTLDCDQDCICLECELAEMHVVSNIIRLLPLKIISLIVSDVEVELPYKLLSLLSTPFSLLTLLDVADDADDAVAGDDDDANDADGEVVVDGRSTRAVHVIWDGQLPKVSQTRNIQRASIPLVLMMKMVLLLVINMMRLLVMMMMPMMPMVRW